MKKLLIFFSAIFIFSSEIFAQADTIHAKNNKLLLSNLHEGRVEYLVYNTDSLFNRKNNGDIWERRTSFVTFHDMPAVKFEWNWFHNDSLSANIINYCDRNTFAPVFHKAVYKKRGTMAYDFRDGKMIPSDTIADNAASKRAPVNMDIPVISWEQDLETYPLLPVKKIGQKFEISFFDPNEKAPTYHLYEVTGKEDLQISADVKVKCWLLKIDYSKDSYAIFWLSEKSKEVLKMKEYFRGSYRFKVRLY